MPHYESFLHVHLEEDTGKRYIKVLRQVMKVDTRSVKFSMGLQDMDTVQLLFLYNMYSLISQVTEK